MHNETLQEEFHRLYGELVLTTGLAAALLMAIPYVIVNILYRIFDTESSYDTTILAVQLGLIAGGYMWAVPVIRLSLNLPMKMYNYPIIFVGLCIFVHCLWLLTLNDYGRPETNTLTDAIWYIFVPVGVAFFVLIIKIMSRK